MLAASLLARSRTERPTAAEVGEVTRGLLEAQRFALFRLTGRERLERALASAAALAAGAPAWDEHRRASHEPIGEDVQRSFSDSATGCGLGGHWDVANRNEPPVDRWDATAATTL